VFDDDYVSPSEEERSIFFAAIRPRAKSLSTMDSDVFVSRDDITVSHTVHNDQTHTSSSSFYPVSFHLSFTRLYSCDATV